MTCRLDLMKRRWMTHHSSACISVLTVLAHLVGNFKQINMELLAFKLNKVRSKWKVVSGDDDVSIAPTKHRKWVTQLVWTVQSSCKNRFVFCVFTHKGSLMSSYKRFTTLPLNIKRSELDSKPPKTLAKPYNYPPQDKEKKKGRKKRIR